LNVGTELKQVRAGDVAGVAQDYQPRIVAFLCRWCSYAGADLAGGSRIKYPANVRIIRVPCSCRIDPKLVLKSLEGGADGVLVSGCHPGDCHYTSGNYYARRRMIMFRKLLEFVGVDPRRFHMSWVSASEGHKWAQVVSDVTEEVKSLGPRPSLERSERPSLERSERPSLERSEAQSRAPGER
jgi:F420-non-reducing hydrogenase iron-sulfur subunit